MKERLINLLFKYKSAIATDKEPLGAIIGHEVDIILNVEKHNPTLFKRPAYPDIPRARESLEVHIKELMDLGVLNWKLPLKMYIDSCGERLGASLHQTQINNDKPV
ncbi:hypothetical protein O181_083952 [Austropuccinia psidii MF-1]|uniref:Uncharacterized protein n=1 Tax=Austropuccinia psidii MF-1 TaxID=1389203 RepID=A0A9Q3FTA4_9BASI|nr:hypothetical protein [Austropuccinia psidii MF-1]